MLRFHYFLLALLSCVALYGCATIIHGTTQDVSIIMPKGTEVTEAFGNEPILSYSPGGNVFLRLKRNKDYSLRFLYKGQEARTVLSSSLEPGWLFADLFTDFIGYIVDGITGAWNSFDDPVAIRFPADTSLAIKYTHPEVEVIEDSQPGKFGIVVSGNLGLVFPMEQALATSYGMGIGYEAFPRFSFLLAYQGGSGVNILSQYSNYFTSGAYSHFNLECRFKAQGNLYLTAGGGLSNITSDSLELDRSTYSDSLGRVVDSPIRSAPANKWMPSLFVGIGISDSVGFIELRHTFGLSAIPLSNGETGHFATTALTFGVNLRF